MMHNTGMTSGGTGTVPGALSIAGPQPVWMILDEARVRGFTGEVVFEVDPEVLAYFDGGVIYYAERATDVSLGRRLVDAGVIEPEQLVRGTVRVGDVEHLGRLFERDRSVDRDAVLVLTETSSEDLIAELANREIATIRVTAYRHHPSGLHRWFVAPIEHDTPARPVSEFGPLGAPSVDDMPALTLFEDNAELSIEWDEAFDGLDGGVGVPGFVPADEFTSDTDLAADPDVIEMSFAMAEFVDADAPAEPTAIDADVADAATTDMVTTPEQLGDAFMIVWPDGTEERASESATGDLTTLPTHSVELTEQVDLAEAGDVEVADLVEADDVAALAEAAMLAELAEAIADTEVALEAEVEPENTWSTVEVVPTGEDWLSHDDSGVIEESAPDESEVANAAVEVDAVDVAVAAAEWAAAAPVDGASPAWAAPYMPVEATSDVEELPTEAVVDEMPAVRASHHEVRLEMPALDVSDDPDIAREDVPDDVAEAVRRAIAAIESVTADSISTPAPVAPAAAAFGGFAPPTLDMSAEVIYARIEAGEINGIEDVMPTLATPTLEVDGSTIDVLGAADDAESPVGTAVAADDTDTDTDDDDGELAAVTAAVAVAPPAEVTGGGGNERTSALKRLIGSLRRHDR